MRNTREKSGKNINKDSKETAIEKTQGEKISEENISDENKISAEKTKEVYLTKAARIVLYIVGVFVLLASIAALFINLKPYEKTEDVKVNSYNITADASYKVHLQENSIFEDEFLEEGRLYPSAVTDFVSVEFKSEISLLKDVNLSGEYNIAAVLEGYGDGDNDEKTTIYEKTYPLTEGKIEEQTTHFSEINESLSIERLLYKDYARDIETVIGGETAKDFYILFSGKYNIDGEEKTFSYKVNIPISNEKFYKIQKDGEVADSGDITETTTEKVNPKFSSYVIYIILFITAAGLIVFVKFFTKDMEGERLKLKRLSNLMRKYGSQMICVEDIPLNSNKNEIRVKSMVDFLLLSQEIRESVIYCEDENGLPKDGRFYILSKDYIYFLDAYND